MNNGLTDTIVAMAALANAAGFLLTALISLISLFISAVTARRQTQHHEDNQAAIQSLHDCVDDLTNGRAQAMSDLRLGIQKDRIDDAAKTPV
jgi:hypothetical protein